MARVYAGVDNVAPIHPLARVGVRDEILFGRAYQRQVPSARHKLASSYLNLDQHKTSTILFQKGRNNFILMVAG
jgi:hypothetical protein